VPAGAWLGLQHGWRATFWAVAVIGVVAFVVLAIFVPKDSRYDNASTPLREELAVLARPQVLLGLAITVFGFAGVFALFTYIQPLLTRLAGLSESAVSPALLLMGAGLAVGNILGGKLADRALMPSLLASLAALALVLVAMPLTMQSSAGAMLFVALLGVVSFATVAPMQMRVLEKASGAGQNLASSLNIAAFNLGNALGAGAGGLAISHGPGLASLGWVAALLTAVGLVFALWSYSLDRRAPRAACAAAA